MWHASEIKFNQNIVDKRTTTTKRVKNSLVIIPAKPSIEEEKCVPFYLYHRSTFQVRTWKKLFLDHIYGHWLIRSSLFTIRYLIFSFCFFIYLISGYSLSSVLSHYLDLYSRQFKQLDVLCAFSIAILRTDSFVTFKVGTSVFDSFDSVDVCVW